MMDAFWATEKQKLWHKRRRAQLDPAFNVGVRTRELVRAREAAREKGIYSGHPDYPVLSDIPDPGLKA